MLGRVSLAGRSDILCSPTGDTNTPWPCPRHTALEYTLLLIIIRNTLFLHSVFQQRWSSTTTLDKTYDIRKEWLSQPQDSEHPSRLHFLYTSCFLINISLMVARWIAWLTTILWSYSVHISVITIPFLTRSTRQCANLWLHWKVLASVLTSGSRQRWKAAFCQKLHHDFTSELHKTMH